MKKLILLIFILTATISISQEKNSFEWPNHAVTPVFKDLLKAYNTNDFKTISAYSKKYYSEKKAKKKAIYWMKIFTEYGVLKPYKLADKKFRGQPAIWFQGSDTKNWAKIVIMLTKDGKNILNAGVFKGMRPIGLLPPYKEMPTKNVKKHLNKYLKNLSELDLFSGAVLVAKGDKILYRKAYGYRNKEKGKKTTLTQFLELDLLQKHLLR
ncbi:hypothetical protein [Tenacibaculum retecalamus]|uniref:hypothetical protein n=1 Tax=Tenacibaculum retecalamus TaxID=3018315 RepID=UPI0023D94950|nr:hypothetical protein [Tenacibaculum retecalamus]WBX70105.1 hypothetical protein PG912_07320 [Tenacibaculum retecalamus]